ncbi:hypothetical protein IGS68_33500 (plasmid) [Skermanella sp. TT6]|uniref:Uncharacterized protein n=1 Tax=Skermanella cutis TaxID=2775420 RepID=A0ABX7BH65_9PROT|nr:hypothetical protein [Skermanella sp. TT6]QQP93538.1 hypothetical protein IGS68_33500 [Skermanella sp. TT6]
MIRNDPYAIAELRGKRGDGDLHQSRITNQVCLETFPELYEQIRSLTYPDQQPSKFHTFGWSPALFDESVNRYGEEGLWRVGSAASDEVSCFFGDIDNANPDQPEIRMEDAEQALEDLGLSFFLYPSYSHDEDGRHKFRVVIDSSRAMTWDECFRVAGVLGHEVFGQQGDFSIYDKGDHLYGPAARYGIGALSPGDPLDVDATLARWDALPAAYRLALRQAGASTAPRQSGPTRPLTEEEAERFRELRSSTKVRPFTTLKNPRLWNANWNGDYKAKIAGGSHWQTMRSLLSRIWMKSGATLAAAEMTKLFQEIDAQDGGYFQAHYPGDKLEALLDFIMSQPVGDAVGEASPEGREQPAPAPEGETTAPASMPREPRNAPEVLLIDETIPGHRAITEWLRGERPSEKILKSLTRLREKKPLHYAEVLAQLLVLNPDPMLKDAFDAHLAA